MPRSTSTVPPTSADRPRGSLVVGGANGIGRAIAHALAARGDDVVVADIDTAAAATLVEELRVAGLSARSVELDVTDVAQVRDVVAAVDGESPLGTVVANAGVAFARPLAEVEPAEYDGLMAVNVRGVFFVLQAAVRAMTPRGRGSIVTICSTSGFTASTGPMSVYDTSKGAVRLLTQAAAREVAASGLRSTPWRREPSRPTSRSRSRRSRRSRSLARIANAARSPRPPEEIAAAVAFLSSDDAAYVTGHVLVVDGGWLA